MAEYPLEGETLLFAFSSRAFRERVLFIIPPEAPSPDWEGVSPDASTSYRFPEKYVTFVRTPSGGELPQRAVFRTFSQIAQKRFRTEACQAILMIQSRNLAQAAFGEEIICNSWAIAATFRDSGVSPDDYQGSAREISIGQSFESLHTAYLVKDYAEIPPVNLIFK